MVRVVPRGSGRAALDDFHLQLSLPFRDHGTTKAQRVLKPWLDGTFHVSDLFRPHSEHRMVLAPLLGLGLLWVNGQWGFATGDGRERYLSHLRASPPLVFVDAVAPASFGYDVRAADGIKTFPALASFIDEHYELKEKMEGSALLSLTSIDFPARAGRALLDLIRQKGQMDYASSMGARDSRSEGKIAVGKKSSSGEGAFGLLNP